MYARRSPEGLLAFVCFISQASTALSQSTATTFSTSALSSDPTSTSQAPASAETGNGDGGGVPAGASEPTTAAGSNAAGAAGGAGGSINLSSGSTIAIAVVVSVVVLLAIGSTILWYIAKKRQWKVAESIRNTIQRVGSAIASPLSPRTPRGTQKMNFPSPRTQQRSKSKPPRLYDPVPNSLKGRVQNASVDMTDRKAYANEKLGQGDLEKGTARPTVARLQIPQSSFDMDSPGSGRVSVWAKVFGRK